MRNFITTAIMIVGLVLAGIADVHAFDACRNVSFKFTNAKNVAIEVKKIKYYNSSEARWETENVKNRSEHCGAGQTCTIEGEDLGGDENDRITKVIFIYEDANSSVERESKAFLPTDPVCRAEKIYGYGQMWTIGGSKEADDGDINVRGQSASIDPDIKPGPATNMTMLKTPTASKSASLIYFNFGENSEYTRLFQDTVKLKKAMQGYQRVVLLKSQEVPSWADFNEGDEKNADVMLSPTKANFFDQIKDLTAKGFYIDIYIFSHGWEEQFGPKNNDNQVITSADITSRLSGGETGYKAIPIRMIWSSTCYGRTLADEWTGVGAKTVAGARFVNFYPNTFGHFIDDWNKENISFSKAIADSDTSLVRTAAQTYILGDATATRQSWGGCPLLQTVLGSNDCAKDYFVTEWIDRDEWMNGKSGKDNMNNSSALVVTGNGNLTKNSKPKW